MGHSRKIRNRAKLIAATKPAIRPKRLGLKSDTCLSAKDRQERSKRRERHQARFHEEFRREARQEPPRLPIGPTALEQAAIAEFSDAIAARIVSYLRNVPVEIALIPKDMKHGTRTKVPPGYTVKLSAFGQLAEAIERRARAGCEA